MRRFLHSLWIASIAIVGAIVLTMSWPVAWAIQLQARTALIMGGTDHPLTPPRDLPPFVTDYLNNAVNGYLNPAAAAGTGVAGPIDNAVAVYTPEEFFPIFGLTTFDASVATGRQNLGNCLAVSGCIYNNDPAVDPQVGSVPPAPTDSFVVFGFSQSAVIASLTKRDLINNYQPGDPSVSFVTVANPMRPNGGILSLGSGLPTIPILGVTFYGAAPNNSAVVNDGGTPDDPSDDTYAYPTVDIAQQYDALGGDFPVRPLNLLATANSILSYVFLHNQSVYVPFSEAQYQGRQGDTSYYIIPSDIVPILKPLQQIGIPQPILSALDAPLRVLIEDAYDRNVSPGIATSASILPIGNPISLAFKLIASVPVAVDNLLAGLGLGRPLGTSAPGLFGVGGLPLPPPPSTPPSALTTSTLTSALARQAPELATGNDGDASALANRALVPLAKDDAAVDAAGTLAGAAEATGTSPESADAVPNKVEATPEEVDTVPAKGDVPPANLEATPKEVDTPPAKDDASPTNEDPAPAKQDPAPAKHDLTPADVDVEQLPAGSVRPKFHRPAGLDSPSKVTEPSTLRSRTEPSAEKRGAGSVNTSDVGTGPVSQRAAGTEHADSTGERASA